MTFFMTILTLLCAAAAPDWTTARFGDKEILLDPRCRPLPTAVVGPFAALADGSVLAIEHDQVLISRDDGKNWSSRPLFAESEQFACCGEGVLLRTRAGTLIFAFMNERQRVFAWDQSRGGPLPECRLPVYITCSRDEAKTWSQPALLQDGYCGALRTIIQLRDGRVVLGSQLAVRDPGRHVCFSYVSDDEGKSWRRSNTIDLGQYGQYGDHGGGIEPTLVGLRDGRLWMLIRTYRGRFSEAFSSDGGLTWKDIRPSKIEASGSPGQLLRLGSGRLVLLWNRFVDKVARTGRREQLSLAFSEDDGKTWSPPAVIAYDPMQPGHKEPDHRLSYPYLYEHKPGQLWVTTGQGPVRISLREADFIEKRSSTRADSQPASSPAER